MARRIEVRGMENFTANLEAIENAARGKVLRTALRAGANKIRDQARMNALREDDPTTKEAIYKNVAVAFGKKETQSTGNMTMRVGVLGGAGRVSLRKDKVTGQRTVNPNDSNPGGDTRYWRMLEFGTKNMAAKPFLRPAMNQAAETAVNAFVTSLNRGIARVIKKSLRED